MGYKDVTIPPGKDPEDYSYQERRAELLDYIIELGHPSLVNRTEAAERYDVAVSTICLDIDRIAESVAEELGTDADLVVHAIFEKGLKELAREKDWEAAMQFAERWLDLLMDYAGAEPERAASKHDIDADIRQAAIGADTRFEVVLGGMDAATVEGAMAAYADGDLGFAATPDSGEDAEELNLDDDAVDIPLDDGDGE